VGVLSSLTAVSVVGVVGALSLPRTLALSGVLSG